MIQRLVIDHKTGHQTHEALTDEELSRRQLENDAAQERKLLEESDAAAREAALESGRAKLLALGLSENEVEAMTNG